MGYIMTNTTDEHLPAPRNHHMAVVRASHLTSSRLGIQDALIREPVEHRIMFPRANRDDECAYDLTTGPGDLPSM